MAKRLHIPVYSDLTPKRRQQVHMVLGGVAAVCLVLFVSGFVGSPSKVSSVKAAQQAPKPRAIGAVPGEQLDPKDVWVGNAGKEVTRLREDVKDLESDLRKRVEAQERTNKALLERIEKLTGERIDPKLLGVATAPAASASAQPQAAEAAPVAPLPAQQRMAGNTGAPRATGAADGQASNAPAGLGGQPRTQRLPAVGGNRDFPPGRPNGYGQVGGPVPQQGEAQQAFAPPPTGLMRVSQRTGAGAESQGSAAPAPGQGQADQPSTKAGSGAPGAPAQAAMRKVDSFLPVSYTRATLLGGLAAPTGGQSQNNPVPVLLRLVDMAVLPNQFRGYVRDCLVVGEGFGDQSSERAYIRTTMLSCVLKDGTVVEVPIKGSVFGEDGMNGMRGALVTKQGQILTNALLSGIAAGIGQGLAQSTQQVTSTALGSTTTNPTDTKGILKQGLGDGVGKALDRLSQYYINLAEKTFPVIEIQPGRTVDVVITQGVQLDLTTVGGKAVYPNKANGMAPTARTLLRTAADEDAEE